MRQLMIKCGKASQIVREKRKRTTCIGYQDDLPREKNAIALLREVRIHEADGKPVMRYVDWEW